MTNMFPSMYRGGQDDSRHPHPARKPVTTEPTALKAAYWLMLAASMFMIFAGLVIATIGYTGDPNVDPKLVAAVEVNQRIVGIVNMVIATVLVFLIVQVRRGFRKIRPWIVGVIAFAIVFDVIAFVFKAGGFAVALIPILLASVGFLIYRPIVSDYLDDLDPRSERF